MGGAHSFKRDDSVEGMGLQVLVDAKAMFIKSRELDMLKKKKSNNMKPESKFEELGQDPEIIGHSCFKRLHYLALRLWIEIKSDLCESVSYLIVIQAIDIDSAGRMI